MEKLFYRRILVQRLDATALSIRILVVDNDIDLRKVFHIQIALDVGVFHGLENVEFSRGLPLFGHMFLR